MLLWMILYNKANGLTVWEKSFEPDTSSDQIIMYSSFFSAIQSFVMEIIRKNKSSTKEGTGTGLSRIDLGDKYIKMTLIPSTELELITIAEKTDSDLIEKLHLEIPSLLNTKYVDLIQQTKEWSGDLTRFQVLDHDMLQIIDILGKSRPDTPFVFEQQKIFLKLPALKEQKRKQLEDEKRRIYERIKRMPSMPEKIQALEQIWTYAQEFQNPTEIANLEHQIQKSQKELSDIKTRVVYYIAQIKAIVHNFIQTVGLKSLDAGNYRDIYLNTYSFASKLRLYGAETAANHFKGLAEKLLGQERDPDAFANILKTLLNLSEIVEDYKDWKE
jgi:hypothetical protein